LRKSDHFDGVRFFNPSGAAGQPFSALPRLFRTPRARWPLRVSVTPTRPPAFDDATAVVTFVGHSTWLIQTERETILTDPMYSRRAGPFNRFGPERVRDPAVAFDDLPPITLVLLSHNHYDHCDVATLRQLSRKFDPLVVTPVGNGRLLRSIGLRRYEELDWWQRSTGAGLPITVTPAQHFSARHLFDRNRALWGGFTLDLRHARLYFAGDSGYGPMFRQIGERLGPIDLALLPVGAYEPRWFMKDIHMNPAEAVQAHLDLGAKQTLGMHFGTFQLTTEAIDEPQRALAIALASHRVPEAQFQTLEFGGSFFLGKRAADSL
jgi:L-ascorbate metabolism protein UlaG (beta-lactamase superfamily)